MAARGTCNQDTGEQPLEDPAARTQLKRQAWMLYVKSAGVAALLTLVFLFP